MNKEILMVVDAVSNEKGVDKEIIFDALEAALASATRKKHGEEWTCASPSTARPATTTRSAAGRCSPTTPPNWKFRSASCASKTRSTSTRTREVGGFVEEPMESVAFGRIAAQTAKQVIVQKVREAERAQVVDAYKDRVGTLVSGVVKRVDRNGIYVDLGGNAEGFMPRDRDDSARAGARAGPHQGVPARTCAPSRAARSCS